MACFAILDYLVSLSFIGFLFSGASISPFPVGGNNSSSLRYGLGELVANSRQDSVVFFG